MMLNLSGDRWILQVLDLHLSAGNLFQGGLRNLLMERPLQPFDRSCARDGNNKRITVELDAYRGCEKVPERTGRQLVADVCQCSLPDDDRLVSVWAVQRLTIVRRKVVYPLTIQCLRVIYR